MSSILSIGTSALLANQQVLRATGNNIANVNTPGYSRQNVKLEAIEGLSQGAGYQGAGYYGRGVDPVTIMRSHSEMLTRQVSLTGAVAAADSKRLEQLKKLEELFPGGKAGLGASVGDLLNSFSDVANAPSDLTARTVALARADEMTARFRATSADLTNLRESAQLELVANVRMVNSLAARIAENNKEIRNQQGSGHTPNDLLDKRDELIRELNTLVQTTSIPASDGSVGIFIGGSQPLVLGTTVTPLKLEFDSFGDPLKSKLTMQRDGQTVVLEEATLGGGALSGMLRFKNTDLVDASNMMGRMALALGTVLNQQHRLGLDVAGNPGGDLLTLGGIPNGLPALTNTGGASIQVAVQTTPASGAPALAASDYEITFTGAGAGSIRRLSDRQTTPEGGAPALAASDYEITFTGAGAGSIRRLSDGQTTAFAAVPIQIDGLELQVAGVAAAGDRFMVTPYRQVTNNMDVAFASANALAVASPVVASAGVANQGSLTLQTLLPQQADVNLTQTVTLTFTGPGTFDVNGVGTGNPNGVAYVPGQAISYNGWALTLKGSPQVGDTYTVQVNAYPAIDAGNGHAMLAIRDQALFDGAATTDGYAGLMSEIGVRVQSAGFASAVSDSIAAIAAADNAALVGVNLDEEASKLLQFQQAYQASAKILQVAQTVFDTLIQNLGR